MRTFLPLCVAVLLLAGCQQSSNTSVTRIRANGVDALYSKSSLVDGVAHFECIASSSGTCHYLLLDPSCSKDAACTKPPLHRLAVAVGKTEQMAGLPTGFNQCVSEQPKEQCHRE
ncbi:hypothetical protein [Stenotrophomonas rhizophila]|jgi:hypothetical protein|uniref:hypothetical protein n=1 Tax=Stenotrophomonas rhizophila TaxID=216778 RepID=UPI0028AD1838|nr:hypothetical protein [Stenotrophomonas rhizophila]